MSLNTITAICNLSTMTWEVTTDLFPTKEAKVNIGFTNDLDSSEIKFNDLKFGFTLKRVTNPSVNEVLADLQYPRVNQRYLSANKGVIESQMLVVDMCDDYYFEVNVEESGMTSTTSKTFTVPLPDQPFPSWRWDGQHWYPPGEFPMPPENEDPLQYEWSEDEQGWVKIAVDPDIALNHPDRV